MYHFRYYAIGHSYLLHGPFVGWQTEGQWGMAASAPEQDYFHRFQACLKERFECEIEAVAENHATYERRCVVGATREDYELSPEYAQMKEVLTNFKPNLISLFIGDGNTVAKDDESLTRFLETLYDMVAQHRRPDAVVVCLCMKQTLYRLSKPIADRYGFLPVDVSFLHEKKGYDNPYYAFRDYPEYDEKAAAGAVEFRTHPSDLGHDAIAKAMLDAVKDQIPTQIAQGSFLESYRFAEYVQPEKLPRFSIRTEPEMFVHFHGFNVRQEGECVTFGSAPETGASIEVGALHVAPPCGSLCVELAVGGVEKSEQLTLTVTTKTETHTYTATLQDDQMHRYTFDLSDVPEKIRAIRLSPKMRDCVLTVRAIEFLKA